MYEYNAIDTIQLLLENVFIVQIVKANDTNLIFLIIIDAFFWIDFTERVQ